MDKYELKLSESQILGLLELRPAFSDTWEVVKIEKVYCGENYIMMAGK